jgi:hypothetical protein
VATIQLELFAFPQEILGILQRREEVSLSWKTLVRHQPDFSLELIPPEAPLTWPSEMHVDCVCLTAKRPDLTASSVYEYLLLNPGALVVDFGRQEADSLSVSAVGARTDDPTSLKRWQPVVRELKKATQCGLWARNPETGAKGFYKNFRYTEGARLFSLQGGSLRPAAGWNVLSVAEPA